MQGIAKAALIICATFMAYHTQEYRFLYLWFLVLFDWD